MKKRLLAGVFLFSTIAISAQDHTGVWWGSLNIVAPGNHDVRYMPILKLNPASGTTIVPRIGSYLTDEVNKTPPLNWNASGASSASLYPTVVVLDSNSVYTKAKLEVIQSGDKMLVQLTSFAPDNRQITMYTFEGKTKKNDRFSLKGTTNLVNETIGQVPLFDLDGKFFDTAGASLFSGVWTGQLSHNRLGNFVFQKTNEGLAINPELVHMFLNPSNREMGAEEAAKLPVSSTVYDSLETTSFSIDASMLDNGIPDSDTLSIWLNGRLMEDNVVPGKKRFLFRAVLEKNDWNHLTIRCKSEGKIKGTGILLNMNTDEQLLKYNLVMYKNDEADWIIKRNDKKQKELTSSQ